MERYPEALELVDDEGSALVRTEFVGWLAPNCQRELSIGVLIEPIRTPAARQGSENY
jgi:hypothetical protein